MLVVETERLRLRWLTVADADFIYQLVNEAAFIRFIGDKGVRTLEDAAEYILNGPIASYARWGFGLYLVELKGDLTPVGLCGLLQRNGLRDVDLGYAVLPAQRRRGYACEAGSAVLAYGHRVFGLQRVVAITHPDNRGSIRVLDKLGFRFEQRIRLASDSPEVCLFGCDLSPAR